MKAPLVFTVFQLLQLSTAQNRIFRRQLGSPAPGSTGSGLTDPALQQCDSDCTPLITFESNCENLDGQFNPDCLCVKTLPGQLSKCYSCIASVEPSTAQQAQEFVNSVITGCQQDGFSLSTVKLGSGSVGRFSGFEWKGLALISGISLFIALL